MYLNCKTFFSYRYGTYGTEELVQQAKAMGVKALALTNINGSPDAWDFVHYCRDTKHGAPIQPILGNEIRNGSHFCYLLIARNNAGIMEINRFISEHKMEDKPFPERPAFSKEVFIIYALGRLQPGELLNNELIGVKITDINKLFNVPVKKYPQKFVIRQPVTFQSKKYFNLHRLLRAIDLNTLLSKLNPEDVASPDEMFVSEAVLEKKFSEFPDIITCTRQLMEACGTDMVIDPKSDKNKQVYGESLEEDRLLLEEQALKGMRERYPDDPVITERVQKELKVVNDLNFNAYFLIVWDVVNFARKKGFYYVGRGSGANSIIAYNLKITDVDPIELDLYFERFLNKFRTSPPDFDMDFSHKDRNEIISYIFEKHGKDHVALLGMHSTFQKRAAIRELGKVLGLPKEEIDILVKNKNASFQEDSMQKVILKYAGLMKDFPNHLSIHAGGMLISDQPIHQYTALELPPKGFPTSQIDMFGAERVGLIKLDILSQRGLGHIKDTIQLVKHNQGISIDIDKVEDFMTDPKVADQIRRADT